MYRYELLVIPTPIGLCKVYVYGFHQSGSRGKVYATMNDVVVSRTGYHRTRTILKAVENLYHSILKN